MEESRGPETLENNNDSGASGSENQDEATSKETLSDIETDVSPAQSEGYAKGEPTSTPSPDGQFDEGGERDKAGPM